MVTFNLDYARWNIERHDIMIEASTAIDAVRKLMILEKITQADYVTVVWK